MIKEILNRRRILPLLFMIGVLLALRYYNQQKPRLVTLNGQTMGTFYSIKYISKGGINYQASIDSLLKVFNQSLSTYIPESEISQFNRGSEFQFDLPFFYPVLQATQEIYENTEGAFDPTIMPLVRAWGFGPGERIELDSAEVDSLRELIDFKHIQFDNKQVRKDLKNVELDFSSIAKGYGVDVVADYLKDQSIQDLMVNIGGEVVCKGLGPTGKIWRIGIDVPKTGNEEVKAVVELKDRAIATSGNYRNFYIKDGVKYAHTISPFTGYPVTHSLLSASVFAKDCMSSDAYATAFMVLGMEKSIEILDKHPDLDAYLIYSDREGNLQTYVTEGIKPFISEPN
ncbi:FAD:protein FMN transferase [Xanthovirga aplysinae]|uniref:FAD:protein FMN transferase n=1 Tax=Xanthovirga aplysinae TaxID=2529853 RepID=UPI0012BD18D5|nr:FAD:protein FMN transferase [Xanthovirga aplysinae]MTI32058.1 FAD:protein FMN transferase [Xanthovirga aplysinae]